jgi:hypothetical protein
MTEPIDWAVVDTAIQAWIVAALPISAAQAIWSDQNTPQPSYPYVTLKRSGFSESGLLDETRETTDLTQDAGEEIELLTTGPREITLAVTAHTDPAQGSYDNPNANATALLSLAQSSLGQRSVLDAFDTAGIAIVERLPVEDTSVVVNGEWLSQAAMDVRLRVVSNMTEDTGYIDKVKITSTFGNAKASLDLDDYLIDGS